MAALDHMDRVDLDVSQMFNREPRCVRAVAKGRALIEPLGGKPHLPRQGFGNQDGGSLSHHEGLAEYAARSRGAWLRCAPLKTTFDLSAAPPPDLERVMEAGTPAQCKRLSTSIQKHDRLDFEQHRVDRQFRHGHQRLSRQLVAKHAHDVLGQHAKL